MESLAVFYRELLYGKVVIDTVSNTFNPGHVCNSGVLINLQETSAGE